MTRMRSGGGLLDGVKVLDFTRFLAGPTCTRILADLGAEVIKIEQPPLGDFARQMHRMKETKGIGPMFLYTCAGKKSVCINIKPSKGLAVLRQLLKKVDVVVDNFAPGVMQRLGLDWASIEKINPKVVAVSISGFGQFGPWSQRKSFDIISQALSGVMHMTGEPDGKPQYVGNNIGDPVAGLHAAVAVCGALFKRDRTGRGQYVDISQLDSLLWIDMFNTSICALSGGNEQPDRFGSHHYSFAPLGVFKASSGYVVIHVFETAWQNFTLAIGHPEIYDDSRFARNSDRLANRQALIEIIEGWLAGYADPNEAVDTLHRFGIPCARVLDIQEALNHPQVKARSMLSEVTHPILGRYPIVETPFHLSESPGCVRGPAPLLGQHNAEVLSEYLGYEPAEIQALCKEGILCEEDVTPAIERHSTVAERKSNEYA